MAFWRSIPAASDVLTDETHSQSHPSFRQTSTIENHRGRSSHAQEERHHARSRSKSVSGRLKRLVTRSKSRGRTEVASEREHRFNVSKATSPYQVRSSPTDLRSLKDDALRARQYPPSHSRERTNAALTTRPSLFRDVPSLPCERPKFEPLVNLLSDEYSAAGFDNTSDVNEDQISRSTRYDVDHLSSDFEAFDLSTTRSRDNESPRPPSYHSNHSSANAISCSTTTSTPAGLVNLGNTCFMAVVLQSLANLSEIQTLFVEGDYKSYLEAKGTKGPLCKATARLLKAMSKNKGATVAPSAFHRTFCAIRSEFKDLNQQYDAQEFLSLLIDSLHEELNQSIDPSRPINLNHDQQQQQQSPQFEQTKESIISFKKFQNYIETNDSPLIDLFFGLIKNKLECQTCLTTSTHFQVFSILSLPIPEMNQEVNDFEQVVELADCFNGLLQVDLLQGQDAWFVSTHDSYQNESNVNLTTRVEVNVEDLLDLSDLLPKPIDENDLKQLDLTRDEFNQIMRGPIKGDAEFELCSIVRHESINRYQVENSQEGHYTALIKVEGDWYEADDDDMTLVDLDYVKQYVETAYLLWYRWIPR
ncbi:ubiquitin-specific protease doa4 [Microbotryomycetes sp. JL221]|nr:ubiquitin-specific protease doa4 [Microbotryomycetes sp. JL221]